MSNAIASWDSNLGMMTISQWGLLHTRFLLPFAIKWMHWALKMLLCVVRNAVHSHKWQDPMLLSGTLSYISYRFQFFFSECFLLPQENATKYHAVYLIQKKIILIAQTTFFVDARSSCNVHVEALGDKRKLVWTFWQVCCVAIYYKDQCTVYILYLLCLT